MTTLLAAMKAAFEADGTIISLGARVLTSEEVGREGLKRKNLMVENQVAIVPSVYITESTSVPVGSRITTRRSLRRIVDVYYYQDSGYDLTRQMREVGYQLFDQGRLSYDEPDEFNRKVFWRGDITNMWDEALADVSMERSRFEVLSSK